MLNNGEKLGVVELTRRNCRLLDSKVHSRPESFRRSTVASLKLVEMLDG